MNDGYTRDPKRVEKLLREKGVVVVMGRDHAKTPQDVIKHGARDLRGQPHR